MNKEKRIIENSVLKDACQKSKKNVLSKAGVDKQKVFDELDKAILNKSNNERIKVTPKRKRHKFFTPALGVTACAVICGLLVTGGIMNFVEPQMNSITHDNQAVATESNGSIDTIDQEEYTEVLTQKAVDTNKQSETKDIKKGKIVFSGGEQRVNYTNPTEINLESKSIKKNSCKWTIKNYNNNKVVYSGTGIKVNKELAQMITGKKEDGEYIITFKYEDKNGNQFIINEGFAIRTESADETEQ